MTACELCEEEILTGEPVAPFVMTQVHVECGLRSVMGGIGHHLDHQHWCIEMGDTDGGLSYRESAKAVWKLVQGADDDPDQAENRS